MTTEEKAKAYDGNCKVYIKLINRLEDVKNAIKKQNYGIAMDILCKPYPDFQVTTHSELKESEDERIRKMLIEQMERWHECALENNVVQDIKDSADAIAWLEKQGNLMKALQISNARIGELIENNYYLKEQLEKQGKNNMGISEATKQKLEDNLNKALEKETPESCNEFLEKQGSKKETLKERNICDTCEDSNGCLIPCCAKLLEKQGEQKMKTPEESLGVDSDTYNKIVDECIYGKQKPAEWHREDEQNLNACLGYIQDEFLRRWLTDIIHVKYDEPADLPKGEDYGIDGLYAAIDILQKTLGEVDGYQSDDGILTHKCAISAVKELSKQKPAWSEEDIELLDNTIKFIEDRVAATSPSLRTYIPTLTGKEIPFLKALKERVQLKQKWSEEDNEIIETICKEGDLKPSERVWLKFLKERYTWKPSDGQMLAINTAINVLGKGTINGKYLIELHEQLKKLKG